MSAPHVRRQVRFQGRVQGVGFRQTTYDLARGFRVVGFVQNLPDGRVLLVVEGPADELDRFVAAVVAELGRFIFEQQADEFPATGEFADFSIRF